MTNFILNFLGNDTMSLSIFLLSLCHKSITKNKYEEKCKSTINK